MEPHVIEIKDLKTSDNSLDFALESVISIIQVLPAS